MQCSAICRRKMNRTPVPLPRGLPLNLQGNCTPSTLAHVQDALETAEHQEALHKLVLAKTQE